MGFHGESIRGSQNKVRLAGAAVAPTTHVLQHRKKHPLPHPEPRQWHRIHERNRRGTPFVSKVPKTHRAVPDGSGSAWNWLYVSNVTESRVRVDPSDSNGAWAHSHAAATRPRSQCAPGRAHQQKGPRVNRGLGKINWRLPTLAQAIHALPSATLRLTAEFGKGSGRTTALLPPEKMLERTLEGFLENYTWNSLATSDSPFEIVKRRSSLTTY